MNVNREVGKEKLHLFRNKFECSIASEHRFNLYVRVVVKFPIQRGVVKSPISRGKLINWNSLGKIPSMPCSFNGGKTL